MNQAWGKGPTGSPLHSSLIISRGSMMVVGLVEVEQIACDALAGTRITLSRWPLIFATVISAQGI